MPLTGHVFADAMGVFWCFFLEAIDLGWALSTGSLNIQSRLG